MGVGLGSTAGGGSMTKMMRCRLELFSTSRGRLQALTTILQVDSGAGFPSVCLLVADMEEEGSIAKELYSDILQQQQQLSTDAAGGSTMAAVGCGSCSCNPGGKEEEENGDGSVWGDSYEEVDKAADLDREWKSRRDHFVTLGYRDGILKGKEDSAQEGFNEGFLQSVLVGYNWGLVRGLSSALACLPEGLKEKLIESKEKRDKFQSFYESVQSVSTREAVEWFAEDVAKKEPVAKSDGLADASSTTAGLQKEGSGCGRLENHVEELKLLLLETPSIKSQLSVE